MKDSQLELTLLVGKSEDILAAVPYIKDGKQLNQCFNRHLDEFLSALTPFMSQLRSFTALSKKMKLCDHYSNHYWKVYLSHPLFSAENLAQLNQMFLTNKIQDQVVKMMFEHANFSSQLMLKNLHTAFKIIDRLPEMSENARTRTRIELIIQSPKIRDEDLKFLEDEALKSFPKFSFLFPSLCARTNDPEILKTFAQEIRLNNRSLQQKILATNPHTPEDILLKMYQAGIGPEVKNLILTHPHCPRGLRGRV